VKRGTRGRPLFTIIRPVGLGLALCISASAHLPALGHGGGLNAEGCHNNRKTGDYHCHRAPSVAIPARPEALLSSPQPPSHMGAQSSRIHGSASVSANQRIAELERQLGEPRAQRQQGVHEPRGVVRESFAPRAGTPAGQTCYTGPRGGTYTITASGRKNYGGC
jgi:hypothetical protein